MSITNDDAIHSWNHADPTAFGDEGDFARRHLLTPVILELLGDVRARRILDAGCGQGFLSRQLAHMGALVTGIEPADALFRYATDREESERLDIVYMQHDLSTMHEVQGSFDAVVSNMVFMDIPDYVPAIGNCVAALKIDGNLVFSLSHPCFEEPGSNWPAKRQVEVREYFEEHARPQTYGYLFHRPLSAYLNLIIDLGCTIRRVVEPRLSPGAAEEIANDRDVHVPSFIAIAATRNRL